MFPVSRPISSRPIEQPPTKRIATASQVPALRVPLSDELLIGQLTQRYLALSSPSISERRAVARTEFDIVCDVPQDRIGVSILRPGQALITTGVRPCYAICARAKTADGRTIAGIHHCALLLRTHSIEDTVAEILRPLVDAMTRAGAASRVQLFVLGGEVSRFEQSPLLRAPSTEAVPPDTTATGTVQEGELLMRAAGNLLVGARIGLSDSEGEEHRERDELAFFASLGIELKAATGRPDAVAVFVTHDEVFFVPHDQNHCVAPDAEGNPALCPEVDGEGDSADEDEGDSDVDSDLERDEQVRGEDGRGTDILAMYREAAREVALPASKRDQS